MGLKLIGEVGLDGSGFERGLHRLGERGKEFSTDFVKNATIAAFGFYGVEEAIKKTVETATELVNESKRLDVTVEQLQLLRQAAKDGGTEMGALAGAFEKLDVARKKALDGDKQALAAFAKVGVGPDALKNQTAATIFTTSLSSAAKGRSVEDIGPALKEILGKGFGELIPVLKSDFDELSEKMHRLGSIMDTDTAVKLKSLGDNFDLLKTILVAQLGPALLTVVELIIELIGKIKSAAAFYGGGSANITGSDVLAQFTYDPTRLFRKFDTKEGTRQSQDVENAWQEMIDAMRKKLDDEAKELNNPKPRSGTDDGTSLAAKSHLRNIPSDALVKVGNFLGSNGNTIERANQQKISLMQQQLKALNDLNRKIGLMGVGSFGLGTFPLGS